MCVCWVYVYVCCICVCLSVCDGSVATWWLKHLTVDLEFTDSSPTSYHWKENLLHLAAHPGKSKTVMWGPGLG